MNFDLDTSSAEEVGRAVQYIFAEQVPFATSRAINWTALDFQRAQRERMGDIFTIRRKSFMERSVKIKPFARKQSLEARVSIDSPGGRSDIFGKFETEDTKGPFRGRSVAVPTRHVPRTPTGVIRKGWRPKELLEGGSQHGAGRVFKAKGNVFRGGRRTFLIRRPGGKGTIFMRIDEGQADSFRAAGADGVARGLRDPRLVPLYQLVPQVDLPPDLEFVETAKQTMDEKFDAHFTRSFDLAIRTAR